MLTDQSIPSREARPERAVIFLHGVGDSGVGKLFNIGQAWHRDMPDCEFLFPDGPFPFDKAPAGRQWFSLQQTDMDSMLVGARQAVPYLDEYIDYVLATRQLQSHRLALVGFSQGAIMALYVGIRRVPAIAGIISYSGLLVGSEGLTKEKHSSPPILYVQGTADEIVPYSIFGLGVEKLKQSDLPVTAVTRPSLNHAIDDAGAVEGLRFLKSVFNR